MTRGAKSSAPVAVLGLIVGNAGASSAGDDREKHRDLVLLDRACEEQSAHVARIDAHVDAVLKLLEALGNVPSNSVGYVAPVDTDQRPESAHAYEWATDSPRVTIRMGADAWDASNTSFQGLLRRYAGVSTIEIECQP